MSAHLNREILPKMFLTYFAFCILHFGALAILTSIQQASIKLTNSNSSAQVTCTVANLASHQVIGISKTPYQKYAESVSLGLELSQSYKNSGKVFIETHKRDDIYTDYTLTIERVTLDDYDLYECRVYQRQPENIVEYQFTPNLKARVYFFNEPINSFLENYPICSSDHENNTLVAGSQITLTCSDLGKPPLLLQWYAGNDSEVGDTVKDIGSNETLQIAYNELRLTLQETDNGTIFTCRASPLSRAESQCSIGPFNIISSCSNGESNVVNTHAIILFAVIGILGVLAILLGACNVYLILRLQKQRQNTEGDSCYVVDTISSQCAQQNPDNQSDYYSPVGSPEIEAEVHHLQPEVQRPPVLSKPYDKVETKVSNTFVSVKDRKKALEGSDGAHSYRNEMIRTHRYLIPISDQ